MLRITSLGLSGVLFCLLVPPLQGVEIETAPPPKVVQDQDSEWPVAFLGRVAGVTAETITIKPEGDLRSKSIRFFAGGRQEVVSVYKQDNTKPLRTFVFDDGLLYLNGTLPADRRGKHIAVRAPIGKHKISDVRLGDLVSIDYSRIRDTGYCKAIEILRRPGGRVPPAFGDETLLKDLPHLRIDVQRNAAQQREEKAIQPLGHVGLRLRP